MRLQSGDNLSQQKHTSIMPCHIKVGDALETKRKDVAKTFVTHHIPEVEEDSE